MLTAAPLIAFAATTDFDAARAFYRDTLGLTLAEDEEMALVFDTGGRMLRISLVETFDPQPFTTLGWIVDDIVEAMRVLRERGVVFESFVFLPEGSEGVMTFADETKVAWFKDPDGNMLSVTQFPG